MSSVTTQKTSDVASGSTVQIDDEITYTLSVTVSDAATANDLVLTDTLGAGLTYVDGSASGADFTHDVSGAPVLVFTLPAGAGVGTHEVTYKATVNEN
ncbi:isopeptide-forming domain-containing fimbrial protein, partial [Brucella gallinifaecis]|uniref:isopeptide-forming domain-containing fimbrial protein n=1 Tax=Brucella gallinifaecis TaxID=215590 RepID=UPI00363AA59D